MREQKEGYVQEWYCDLPPMFAQWIPVRDEWDDSGPALVRRIYEIKLEGPGILPGDERRYRDYMAAREGWRRSGEDVIDATEDARAAVSDGQAGPGAGGAPRSAEAARIEAAQAARRRAGKSRKGLPRPPAS